MLLRTAPAALVATLNPELSPELAARLRAATRDVEPQDLNGLAVSYLRFSSSPQRWGSSETRQVEASTKFIQDWGFTLIHDLRDLARSASKGEHIKGGAFGLFLRMVENKTVPPRSLLVIEGFDRITRLRPLAGMRLLEQIIEAKIVIHTLMDNRWYSERSINANSSQLSSILAMILAAHFDAQWKSQRGKDNWSSVLRERASHHCPWWLQPSADRRSYKVIKSRARIIRRLFQEFDAGKHVNQTVRDLNREGAPTPDRIATRKTDGWYRSLIYMFLRSPAVLGYMAIGYMDPQTDTRVMTGERRKRYPRVVHPALFQRVQGRIGVSQRGPITNVRNLLGRQIVCSLCGSTMTWRNPTHLQCWAATRAKCENRTYYAYRPLEQTILDLWLDTALKSGDLQVPAVSLAEIELEALRANLKEITNAVDKLHDAIEQGGFTTIASRLREREAQLAAAKRREVELLEKLAQEENEPKIEHIQALKQLRHDLDHRDIETRTKARRRAAFGLQALIDRVILYPTKWMVVSADRGQVLTLWRGSQHIDTMLHIQGGPLTDCLWDEFKRPENFYTPEGMTSAEGIKYRANVMVLAAKLREEDPRFQNRNWPEPWKVGGLAEKSSD